MTPKSKRADGQPKKRWSAADRAARGHAPRRRGGQPRGPERDQPTDRREAAGQRPSGGNPVAARRPASTAPQRFQGEWSSRPPRSGPTDRSDRSDLTKRTGSASPAARDHAERPNRPDRSRRTTRDEQPWSRQGEASRPSASARPNRDESGVRRSRRDEWSPRDDRPGTGRDDRRQRPTVRRAEEGGRPPVAQSRRASFFDTYDDHRSGADSSRRSFSERPPRNRHASSPQQRQVRPPRERDADHEVDRLPAAEAATPAPAFEGDFADLGVPSALVSALASAGISTPFPIQAATIPDALAGRDVLGRGQTGSGKTLAFGLPMIANLTGSAARQPRGLVLVPTRELAMQVNDVLAPLARTAALSMVLVAGGMSYTPQLRAFTRGVDLVVATPGRLIDLMEQGEVDLTRIEVTVLDEADHMADLGFLPAVTTILDTVPAGGQRMLFSATLDSGVARIVQRYLSDPVTHEVDSDRASVTTMSHHLVQVAPHDKAPVTAEIAARSGRTLVFVRTQRGADRVAEQLRDAGVLAGALHGGLAQGARTRILAAFKDGHVPVLVATDVAARGIHVDDIGLVLQVDPPGGPKEYLHRAGRTARAGGTGTVISLVLPHQRREVTRLTGQAGVRPLALSGEPGSAELWATTGAQRPSGTAVNEADFRRLVDPPVRRAGPRGKRVPNARRGGPGGSGGSFPTGRGRPRRPQHG